MDTTRNAESNIKDNRDYIFEKYCASRGAERQLPTFDRMLSYLRDPIVPCRERSELSMWQFSAIQIKNRASDILAGTTGMMVIRDFVEWTQVKSGRAVVPETIMWEIFQMLAADKIAKDIESINENRKRMEANSEDALKEVVKEIEREAKADQIRAAMTRNFASICEDVAGKKDAPAPAPAPPVQKEKTAKANESDDDDENLGEFINSLTTQKSANVEEEEQPPGPPLHSEAAQNIITEARIRQQREQMEQTRAEHARGQKSLLALSAGERETLDMKLKRYDKMAGLLALEKWKLLRLYGCFVTEISSKILAEMTYEDPLHGDGLLEISTCEHKAMIKRIFELLKPTRDPGLTELFEFMARKSFTFQAFYVYLYQVGCVYADLYDMILRRPQPSKVDKISLPTSQFRGMVDELAEMSLILKYFWGQVVFRQITPNNDTGFLGLARVDPGEMAGMMVSESRTIFVPDQLKMEEERIRMKREGLRYERRYIFKTEMIECSAYDTLVKFCRCREQFHLAFQTFVIGTLPDKEAVCATLMYKARNNPIKHIVMNRLEDNDFYPHEMWAVIGEFDPALCFRVECIQNKTVQILKFGEAGARKYPDPFLEMLAGFDVEIKDFIAGKRRFISAMASLYVIFLVETYFSRHEGLRKVDEDRFEKTWATFYFLPRVHPDILVKRILRDNEPFIAKLTGGMFMLRKTTNDFVVADILTILYLYKEEVENLGGILFFEERYPISDFLCFLDISMHKLS